MCTPTTFDRAQSFKQWLKFGQGESINRISAKALSAKVFLPEMTTGKGMQKAPWRMVTHWSTFFSVPSLFNPQHGTSPHLKISNAIAPATPRSVAIRQTAERDPRSPSRSASSISMEGS